jgi:hypothetical protein
VNSIHWRDVTNSWFRPLAPYNLFGSIGNPIVHYGSGGNRGETLRQIRSPRSKIQENLGVSIDDGLLYRRWSEARQETVKACIDMIETTLSEMGKETIKPSAPEQLGIEMERQQHEIDAARVSLAEWLEVLMPVYWSMAV